MTSISIRKCSIADLADNPAIGALLLEYADEAGLSEIGKPQAQLGTYRALDAAGVLHAFGAFGEQEQLIGFLILLVTTLPHYGAQVGTTESFFVAAAARKTGAGMRLLRAAERHAVQLGAVAMLVSAPIRGALADVLAGHSGYRPTNVVFSRGLREPIVTKP